LLSLRRLVASDRLWILGASLFSRFSNFLSNLILARYGGPATLGAFSAIHGTATTAVSPLLWSLSSSATLEARSAPDESARRAAVAAHVYWALLIACGSCVGFLILESGAGLDGEGASHAALRVLTGLVVVVSMLVTAVLQAALYGGGVYKPVARRLVAVSFICVLVVIPAVLVHGLAGALLALSFQSLLLPVALAHLARPSMRERERVREAFRAATRQLVRSLPNLLATLVAAG
jgi:O-antigen/teichoic acid export membrane protein